MIRMRTTDSPVGMLTLVATEEAIVGLFFGEESHYGRKWCIRHFSEEPKHDNSSAILADAARQLTEYFTGSRRDFDLPLDMHGTPYQRRVWTRLREIPFGQVISYGKMAEDLESSARAVGNANGKNPISIIVPCHRVIASDGTLCGFGGGLDAKEALLHHEGAKFDPHRPDDQAVLF